MQLLHMMIAKQKKIRMDDNKTYYPLIIGMDLLELGIIEFDGTSKSYKLLFKM